VRTLRWAIPALLVAAACSGSSEAAPTTAAESLPATTVATTTTTVPPTTTTTTLPPATTTTTLPSTATTTVPLTTAPPPRQFWIAATGDTLIHEALAIAAAGHAGGDGFDFHPLLAATEPYISAADLAICHFEGTISPDNTNLEYQSGHSHPAIFNVPHQIAGALAEVGFDACSTASNHSFDRGSQGVYDTLDVFDRYGVAHAGTARSPEERVPRLYDAAGVAVGHLSYTAFTNFAFESEERRWELDIADTEAILADAAAIRERGAEFVILSIHWGVEYQVQPTPGQVAMAEELLASPDLDLILGHHTHVVSPIEWIGDEVVVYGLGNYISNIRGLSDGTKIGGEDGMIVHLRVREGRDGRFTVREVRFTPLWVHPRTKQVLVVADALVGGPGAYRAALQASWERSLARALLFEPEGVEVTGGAPPG
jgi:hypothetical protein